MDLIYCKKTILVQNVFRRAEILLVKNEVEDTRHMLHALDTELFVVGGKLKDAVIYDNPKNGNRVTVRGRHTFIGVQG